MSDPAAHSLPLILGSVSTSRSSQSLLSGRPDGDFQFRRSAWPSAFHLGKRLLCSLVFPVAPVGSWSAHSRPPLPSLFSFVLKCTCGSAGGSCHSAFCDELVPSTAGPRSSETWPCSPWRLCGWSLRRLQSPQQPRRGPVPSGEAFCFRKVPLPVMSFFFCTQTFLPAASAPPFPPSGGCVSARRSRGA